MRSSVRPLYADAATLEADIRVHAETAAGDYAKHIGLSGLHCSVAALRMIAVLQRLERTAIERMRVMLVTPTHSDAEVTAFLCTWAYERHWIGEALSAILTHHDHPPLPIPDSTPWAEEFRHRLRPVSAALQTNLIGDDFVAVHLVEGLLDEWLGAYAYRELGRTEPVLAPVFEPILATKAIHARYFFTRAKVDLERSGRSRRLVRRMLRRFSWPFTGPSLPGGPVGGFVRTLCAPGAEQLPLTVAEQAVLPGLGAVGFVPNRTRTRIVVAMDG